MDRTLDASDIIKPYVEPDIDDILEENHKELTPFDFIKSISNNKVDLMADGDPEVEKKYPAYIVNRGLGYFIDTVLHANEMNLYPDMPAKAQYYYYINAIRKGNRFSKWFKHEKDADQEMIQKLYNVRPEVAKMYMKNISETDMQKLRELTATGENSSKKKKNK
jgi:hypothetical protein